jgi:hypothetical protein
MLKKTTLFILLTISLNFTLHADEIDGWDLFDWMEASLKGDWILSPADKQIGTDSYTHKAVLPLVGTKKPGTSYKLIGRETTIQEDLLPNTAKQMVTMYHCKDIDCTTLKATHYCVKQNQPEFIANLKESTENKMIFDCDMSTELCQSNENHVHKIILELSNNGTHLKSSYLSWKNKKPTKKSSIYHFDKK